MTLIVFWAERKTKDGMRGFRRTWPGALKGCNFEALDWQLSSPQAGLPRDLWGCSVCWGRLS